MPAPEHSPFLTPQERLIETFLYLRLTLCVATQFANDFLAKLHLPLKLFHSLLELSVLNTQARDVIMLIGDLEYERSRVADVITLLMFAWEKEKKNVIFVDDNWIATVLFAHVGNDRESDDDKNR